MIDPATGWFEIIQVPNKRADVVSNLLEQTWLTRYPWPTEIVLDRGTEFMAEVINLIENEHGIIRKVITTRNPQANSMVERAHQTVHNMIRSEAIKDRHDLDNDTFLGILSAVRFAMNSTVHTTSQATPGQLVFSRDMMHNIRFEADWQYIKSRKLHRIRQNNANENKTRREHIYKVGEEALLLQDPSRKHGESRYKGPYLITAVHDNGTVTLQSSNPGGAIVTQDWNIRQLSPVRN
jgi:transposase InsO family protein